MIHPNIRRIKRYFTAKKNFSGEQYDGPMCHKVTTLTIITKTKQTTGTMFSVVFFCVLFFFPYPFLEKRPVLWGQCTFICAPHRRRRHRRRRRRRRR